MGCSGILGNALPKKEPSTAPGDGDEETSDQTWREERMRNLHNILRDEQEMQI
jgi:hypothetical protein